MFYTYDPDLYMLDTFGGAVCGFTAAALISTNPLFLTIGSLAGAAMGVLLALDILSRVILISDLKSRSSSSSSSGNSSGSEGGWNFNPVQSGATATISVSATSQNVFGF